MKYAVARLDLGRTRLGVGWTLYDDQNLAFLEMTPRDVKHFIKAGEVKGVKLNENNEIVVDDSFVADLPCKSGVGNYRLISGSQGMIPNNFNIYILVGVFKTPTGIIYEVVTPYGQRLGLSENYMNVLFNTSSVIIGGAVRLYGEIKEADGIQHYILDWPDSDDSMTLSSCKRTVSKEEWDEIIKEERETKINIVRQEIPQLETEKDVNEFFGLSDDQAVEDEQVQDQDQSVVVADILEMEQNGQLKSEDETEEKPEDTKTNRKNRHKRKA